MLGITNPFVHELPEYYSYDITQFKGNIRFLEVVVNREGESNNIVALYFDGAVNYFRELPPPNQKTEVQKVINYINDTIRINIGDAASSITEVFIISGNT